MNTAANKLCLVEDDPIMGESIRERLTLEGYAVDWHKTAEVAVPRLCAEEYQILISDIRLPGMSGERMFEILFEQCANVPPAIFITGFGRVDDAVRLLKLGAADFIVKPFDIESFVDKIDRISSRINIPAIANTELFLGVSFEMREVEKQLQKISSHSTNVLISGETGVGKEVVARRLHQLRARNSDLPFVGVNCGAIPESLLEAELFGFEKGAFTGANRMKKGYFEQSHGGTLFLDEIGEMPLHMQVRLLRVIQERSFQRVGGEKELETNFRLVSATNKDPLHAIQNGHMREDLYYRLNGLSISIPPLRHRKEDIIWLAEKFLDDYSRSNPGIQKSLHDLSREALTHFNWKGNVRELKHAIEQACIMSNETVIMPDDLFVQDALEDLADPSRPELKPYLEQCEQLHLVKILNANDWQIGKSAKQLDISRKNLWERMKRLGIQSAK